MHWVEQKSGRKLVWLVCDLPLRHLAIQVDGPTLSNNKWSGPLGKMLDDVTELKINPNFIKLTIALGLL